MSKLSVHISGSPTGLGEMLKKCYDANSPVSVIYSVNQNIRGTIAQNSPSTKWIYRRQTDAFNRLPTDWYKDFDNSNWKISAQKSVTNWLVGIKDPADKNRTQIENWLLNPADWYDPLNEPVIEVHQPSELQNGINKAKWLNEWCLTALDISNSYNKKLVLYSFPTGSPPLITEIWNELLPSLRLGKSLNALLSLHAYWEKKDPSTDLGDALRYRDLLKILPVDARLPIVISEGSSGNGYGMDYSGQSWVNDMVKWDSELIKDPIILAGCAFQLGVGVESNMQSVLGIYGDYIAANPTSVDLENRVIVLEADVVDLKRRVTILEGTPVQQPFWCGWPVGGGELGRVTDPFDSPRIYANLKHEGIDLDAYINSTGQNAPILAAQDGIVEYVNNQTNNSSYGIHVVIRHPWGIEPNRYRTLYAHLSKADVVVGQVVTIGQQIGVSGNTGTAAVHLHFGVYDTKGLKGYVRCVDCSNFWPEGVINPATVIRNMPTVVESSDGTSLPPIIEIYDTTLSKWTLGTPLSNGNSTILRNGSQVAGGQATLLYYKSHEIYAKNSSNQWWKFENNSWVSATNPIPVISTVKAGLHMAARGGDQNTLDWVAFDTAKLSTIKFLSNHALNDIRTGINKVGAENVYFRMYADPSDSGALGSGTSFFNVHKGWFNDLYPLGVVKWEIHNEPNLVQEGLGKYWSNALGFANWYRQCANLIRQNYPNAKIGWPGLSPQDNMPEYKTQLQGLISEGLVDWIGAHSYWQSEGSGKWGIDSLDGGLYYTNFLNMGKPVVITEASNNSSVDYTTKGNQYKYYLTQIRQGVDAVLFFVSSTGNPAYNSEIWAGTSIPSIMGSR